MNMLLKSVTLVCLISCAFAQILPNNTLHPCDEEIPRGGNGFADDPSGCARYFSCNQGVFTSLSCPAGFHFRATTQTCILASESSCRTCPLTGTAMVPDETSCRNWILCINGVELKQECDAGTAFDPTVRGCVPSANVNCPSTDPCSGAPDGFVADPVSCSNFILCISGIKDSTLTCQPTLQFDHISRRCVLTPRCYPGSSTTPVTPPVSPPVTP